MTFDGDEFDTIFADTEVTDVTELPLREPAPVVIHSAVPEEMPERDTQPYRFPEQRMLTFPESCVHLIIR